MFSNPDFQVDEESEAFKMIRPTLSKRDRKRKKEEQEKLLEQFDEIEEPEGIPSEEEESSSSEDEREWREELRRQRKEAKKEEDMRPLSKPKFYELKSGKSFTSVNSVKSAAADSVENKISLGKRLLLEDDPGFVKSTGSSFGEKEITFQLKKNNRETRREEEVRLHVEERKNLRRSVKGIIKEKRGPVYWRGKRVR